MGVIVFCGPTVDAATVRRKLPHADCRPPAGQGDVYKAARERPAAIALIDGIFLDRPSVWHKEILAALDAGVQVWGAASMGALRAVECEAFGMIGVGRIVAAYRGGRYPPFPELFDDDDEVAVIHGPPELGSQPLSDAMVDLRETLARAEAAAAIDAATRDCLAARLKALPFPERSFAALARLTRDDLSESAAAAVTAGILRHRCSQKHEDALALIDRLAGRPSEPPPRSWNFERTLDWERFASTAPLPTLTDEERAVLAALAEDPVAERSLRRRAAARFAALDFSAGPADAAAELRTFRRERGLLSRASLDDWMEDNLLPADRFVALLEDEARITALAERMDPNLLARSLLDELRIDGRVGTLRPRPGRSA